MERAIRAVQGERDTIKNVARRHCIDVSNLSEAQRLELFLCVLHELPKIDNSLALVLFDEFLKMGMEGKNLSQEERSYLLHEGPDSWSRFLVLRTRICFTPWLQSEVPFLSHEGDDGEAIGFTLVTNGEYKSLLSQNFKQDLRPGYSENQIDSHPATNLLFAEVSNVCRWLNPSMSLSSVKLLEHFRKFKSGLRLLRTRQDPDIPPDPSFDLSWSEWTNSPFEVREGLTDYHQRIILSSSGKRLAEYHASTRRYSNVGFRLIGDRRDLEKPLVVGERRITLCRWERNQQNNNQYIQSARTTRGWIWIDGKGVKVKA